MTHFLTCLLALTLPFSIMADDPLVGLTLDQKIGQLFIGGAYPSQKEAALEGRTEDTRAYEDHLVRDLQVGGLLFKYFWNYDVLRERIADLQRQSHIPLLTAQDLERGLGSRIQDAILYPKAMTLGAIRDDNALRTLGHTSGLQALAVGVNFCLAPVVDLNTNPLNPVIHMRSFGEDRDRVTAKGMAYMLGLQEAGVLASAKHFPGHGDTAKDSHEQLPHLALSRERLESVELHPFRQLAAAGVASIMTSHLAVPAVDPSQRPASLSQSLTEGILRGDMHYDGLIITDDLLMAAIQSHFGAGEACKLAFQAGSDLILSSNGVPDGIRCIKEAVISGEIAEAEVDRRLRRILRAKRSLAARFPRAEAVDSELPRQLYRQAMTLLENSAPGLPLEASQLIDYAVVQVGGGADEPFLRQLGEVGAVHRVVPSDSFEGAVNVLSHRSGVVGVFYPSDKCVRAEFLASAPGSDEQLAQYWAWSRDMRAYCSQHQIPFVAVWFGSPYGLRGIARPEILVLAYEEAVEAQRAAAELLTGRISATAKLPVSIPERYPSGTGLEFAPK